MSKLVFLCRSSSNLYNIFVQVITCTKSQLVHNIYTDVDRWYWQLYFGSKLTTVFLNMTYNGVMYYLIIN